MKDNFSRQSSLYVKYRPLYPTSLYTFIYSHLNDQTNAWDCATGNGQVATVLSKHFKTVVASDISEQQLRNAPTIDNIIYVKCGEELTNYPDNYFDLITVAQAIHWFDFDKFYKEVNRVGKSNSLLAVWGYGLLKINKEIDKIINYFYQIKVGSYWDPERELIDYEYASIPFPYKEIQTPEFIIQLSWTLPELEGYLNTWSSVQKYIVANKENPVDEVIKELQPIWGNKNLLINFPVFLRLGNVG